MMLKQLFGISCNFDTQNDFDIILILRGILEKQLKV